MKTRDGKIALAQKLAEKDTPDGYKGYRVNGNSKSQRQLQLDHEIGPKFREEFVKKISGKPNNCKELIDEAKEIYKKHREAGMHPKTMVGDYIWDLDMYFNGKGYQKQPYEKPKNKKKRR